MHIGKDDDSVHRTSYVLTKRRTERHGEGDNDDMENYSDSDVNDRQVLSRCRQYLIPFQVIYDIRMAVPTNISGLRDCLDDAANKFQLYMGHMKRATVQKNGSMYCLM